MQEKSLSETVIKQLTDTQDAQIKFIKELKDLEQNRTPILIMILGFVLVILAFAMRMYFSGQENGDISQGEFITLVISGTIICLVGVFTKMRQHNSMVTSMAKEHQRLGAEMLRHVADAATMMVKQKDELIRSSSSTNAKDISMPNINI